MHFLELNQKAAHAVTEFIAPRMEILVGYGIEFATLKFFGGQHDNPSHHYR